MENASYIGRFAPSPTGPLHFGSLVAALASYLDARNHDGTWLVRIEDLDPPRESPHAPGEILSQLHACGLDWDQEVMYQSTRIDAYKAHLNKMADQNVLYPCICPRKKISGTYPGTCRGRTFSTTDKPYAIRLKLRHRSVTLDDLFVGKISYDTETDVGDFIVRRKDELFAYQLAVIVDDCEQEVSHVIRGADLLSSTPRQILIAEQLSLPVPRYGHLPLVVDRNGIKLSKQTHALPIDTSSPLRTLRFALQVLGQDTQDRATNTKQLLSNASRQWNRSLVPKENQVHDK
ncbi:MAG TPA: tRNA glutamyl-Q(34) synthetase GluQRS [Gammaproteobacteria bacterium]|nr:tRNA glutamyl-Q(34) synthetase GluQRS [Gammaproteobacteria bacterium]